MEIRKLLPKDSTNVVNVFGEKIICMMKSICQTVLVNA